jgi:hypothetical protein
MARATGFNGQWPGFRRTRRNPLRALRGNNAISRARDVRLGISAKLRRNLAQHIIDSWCGIGATRAGRLRNLFRDQSNRLNIVAIKYVMKSRTLKCDAVTLCNSSTLRI